MNFFERHDQARQNTQQLLGLFVLSIVAIILAIYFPTLLLFHIAPKTWWHPGLFVSVAFVTTMAITLTSLYKIFSLRQGGWVIAQDLGGRLLLSEIAKERRTSSAKHRFGTDGSR